MKSKRSDATLAEGWVYIFVRDGSVWKMIHHQAGPTNMAPAAQESPPDGAVH